MELGVDVVDVPLDGFDVTGEDACDAVVAIAFGHPAQDLQLPGRELAEEAALGVAVLDETLHDDGIDDNPALGDGANHLCKLADGINGVLEQVSAAGGGVPGELSEGLHAVGVVEGEEQDEADVGAGLTEGGEPLDGGLLDTFDAEDHDVGLVVLGGPDEGIGGSIVGGADDLDVGVSAEEGLVSLSEDRLLFGEVDGDLGSRGSEGLGPFWLSGVNGPLLLRSRLGVIFLLSVLGVLQE